MARQPEQSTGVSHTRREIEEALMAWICPKCGSRKTKELWDNTGLGGDIKCNDCGHLWDGKPPGRGGRREGAGRPATLKDGVRVGPVWMDKADRGWLAAQAPTVAEAIRAIVKEKRKGELK